MSTRSLTIVKDESGKDIICLYRQMDGYPEGHGSELFEKFGNYKICNGISLDSDNKDMANGMGCLAAQIVSHFKCGIGSFYLYAPIDSRSSWEYIDKYNIGEEYIYIIYNHEYGRGLFLCLLDVNSKRSRILYDGKFSEFGEFLKIWGK